MHLVMQSDDLPKTIQKFKRHTAKYIIELLTEVTHYIQYLTNQKSDRYERTNFLS